MGRGEGFAGDFFSLGVQTPPPWERAQLKALASKPDAELIPETHMVGEK